MKGARSAPPAAKIFDGRPKEERPTLRSPQKIEDGIPKMLCAPARAAIVTPLCVQWRNTEDRGWGPLAKSHTHTRSPKAP